MSIGIKVGSITDEIGSSDFLHAFFSTVSANLEPRGWGSKYPTLMLKLYQGNLDVIFVNDALRELQQIRKELSKLPPSDVVWDISEPSKQPPWGDKISKDITSLSNYFVTSTGRDLISTLVEAFEDAITTKKPLLIVQC